MYGECRYKFYLEVTTMCNNFWGGNSCWWIIIVILLLSCCGGNNTLGCGCERDNNCGCC